MTAVLDEREVAPPVTEINEADYATVEMAELRLGVRLNLPIYDERMVLLLSAGQVINESSLEKIRNRNLHNVKVHKSELPRLHAGKPQGDSREIHAPHAGLGCPDRNDFTDAFDELLADPKEVGLPPQGEAFAHEFVERGAERFDARQKQEYVDRQQAAVTQVDKVFQQLLRGNGLDLDGLSSITEEAMLDLRNDMDLFVTLGINPHHEGYPARHGMHTCMLAVAIGSHLKLDRPTLKELGMGCLIHDSGMLMVDQTLLNTPRRLRQSEMLEISKHPVRIFDKMLRMDGVPQRSAYIAYQMHERPDGSGYPRQRKKEQIHFLSRVAAVADVYVALAAPRPFREGILPHAALQAIVQAGNEGRLDQSAVQALLRTLSAYPLGSYVQLSDGRVGTVLRSNDMQFERPVVEVWQRGFLDRPSDVIDLVVAQELKILGPLASLTAKFESERRDADQLRDAAQQLNDSLQFPGENPSSQAQKRKTFQCYVSMYVPVSGAAGSPLQWRNVTAVSRGLDAKGITLVTKEEVRSPLVITAFNVKPGARLCLKAMFERRTPLPEGMWEYDLSFQGAVLEPQQTFSLGKV